MILADVLLADSVLGARQWLGVAIALAAVALVVLVWAYARAGSPAWVRVVAGVLKAVGIALLAVCLVEPLFSGHAPTSRQQSVSRRRRQQPQPAAGRSRQPTIARADHAGPPGGEIVLADARRAGFRRAALHLRHDAAAGEGFRGAALRRRGLGPARLAGRAGRAVPRPADRRHRAAHRRQRDRPNASGLDWSKLPPVYPVVPGGGTDLVDLSVARVTVSQTNFEAAPVTITAEIEGQSARQEDRRPRARRRAKRTRAPHARRSDRRRAARPAVLDQAREAGHQLLHGASVPGGRRSSAARSHGRSDARQQSPPGHRRSRRRAVSRALCRRPAQLGIQVPPPGPRRGRRGAARRPGADRQEGAEVHVPRPQRRADQPAVSRLRQPGRRPAEQYDQPVLLRVPPTEEEEQDLQGGFPKDADDLFRYHAVDSRRRRSGVLHAGPAVAAAAVRQPARRRAVDARRARIRSPRGTTSARRSATCCRSISTATSPPARPAATG